MAEYQIKKGGGVGFARKTDYAYEGTNYEADLKDDDIVKILDSGTKETGTFGEQDNFKIQTRNGEKKLAFNQSTINVLVQEFGSNSEGWVGKDVRVILQKKVIAGKKSIVPYLVTAGWRLDEYGELGKEGETGSAQQIADGEAPF